MTKEQLLQTLTEDSFNGVITIPDFKQRVQDYAKMYHTEQCAINGVDSSLTDKEAIDYEIEDKRKDREKNQAEWNYAIIMGLIIVFLFMCAVQGCS